MYNERYNILLRFYFNIIYGRKLYTATEGGKRTTDEKPYTTEIKKVTYRCWRILNVAIHLEKGILQAMSGYAPDIS